MVYLLHFYSTMKSITSPWLFELKRERPENTIENDMRASVAVVGGGIAGVTTAYFLLKYTKQTVILLEANKIAHGATGHNAGQLASYFEVPFTEIVKQFGAKMANEGQRAVESAWDILESIYKDAELKTPYWSFPGYAGCRSLEEVMYHLQDIAYRKEVGNQVETMLISETAPFLKKIPRKYRSHYKLAAQKEILNLLETKDKKFHATLIKRKGCLNSALFTEELAGYLLATYPKRFQLVERSPVSHVILRKRDALLTVNQFAVSAKKVVLCTNGFEKFTIVNTAGPDIDTGFHQLVRGAVGYMAGYVTKAATTPTAISYLPDHLSDPSDALTSDPYFYLTRRPFDGAGKKEYSLVCVGGPESHVEDTNLYIRDEHVYPKDAQKDIDSFLHKTYAPAPKGKILYKFRWHGLMGFTPNGLRCVGVEPKNQVLLYNLGCNGVGILPSLYGAQRIAHILRGDKLKKSIFDPQGKASKRTK